MTRSKRKKEKLTRVENEKERDGDQTRLIAIPLMLQSGGCCWIKHMVRAVPQLKRCLHVEMLRHFNQRDQHSVRAPPWNIDHPSVPAALKTLTSVAKQAKSYSCWDKETRHCTCVSHFHFENNFPDTLDLFPADKEKIHTFIMNRRVSKELASDYWMMAESAIERSERMSWRNLSRTCRLLVNLLYNNLNSSVDTRVN